MIGVRSIRGGMSRGLFNSPGDLEGSLLKFSSMITMRWFAAAPNQMALIKQLREQTGAPISDVKAALQQADWDLEKAGQGLRKKGLAAASKKATRHAAEGLVGIASSSTSAAVIEINSETDFVARNDQFCHLVSSAARSLLQQHSSSSSSPPVTFHSTNKYEVSSHSLETIPYINNSTTNEATPAINSLKTIADAVADMSGTVRENIKLRRGFLLSIPPGSHGIVGTYIHAGVAPGLGRIASLVALEYDHNPLHNNADKAGDIQGDDAISKEGKKKLEDFAHKLAMHIVGALPQYLNADAVPQSALDAERAVLREQAASSGKPENIVEKMVQGRLNKFYEDICLEEQSYVLDDTKKVKQMVSDIGKEVGADALRVSGFVRVQVGQGLEEEKKDFATEVAETLASTH